jgi:hypothetical protein
MSKEQQELVGDAYKEYRKQMTLSVNNGYDINRDYFKSNENGFTPYTQEEFINKCKTDTEFSEKWGLKIEERELSLEERFNIKYPGGRFSIFQENYPDTHRRNNPNDLLDAFDIPTKLITITYNDKTIESYES